LNQPLISVIVPVYKVEPYLEKCLDSIKNQSYKNLEIVLIDDGSPDNCGKICDKYASEDSRFKVIHTINMGLAAARNTGIDNASGGLVTFVDSDDTIETDYCKILYENLKESEAQVSCCGCYCDYGVPGNKTARGSVRVFTGTEASEKMKPSAWAKLYHKELFYGIRYPAGKIMEDKFTTYKVLFKAAKVVYTPKMLYNYLRRADSIIGLGFQNSHIVHIDAVKEAIAFYCQHGCRDAAFRKKKELVSDVAGMLVRAGKVKADRPVIMKLKMELAEAAQECTADEMAGAKNRIEARLYSVLPGIAVSAALLKRNLFKRREN
jgi:glycosyltransferase involved in cell wall biosynthesis